MSARCIGYLLFFASVYHLPAEIPSVSDPITLKRKGTAFRHGMTHVDGISGPDSDGWGGLKEPFDADHGTETRTYFMSRKCTNGQFVHDTVIVQSDEIVLPPNATVEQIKA